jgi:hypothetical protein
MSSTEPVHKDAAICEDSANGPRRVTHDFVHARFRELLKRDGDTGLSVPWEKALLEPPNPLPPNPKEGKRRARLKLPVLIGLLISGTGGTLFVWFSFLH